VLRIGGLPRSGVPRILAELSGRPRAAGVSGRVRVGAAVRAGDVRHPTGRRAVRAGHRRLPLTELPLTELVELALTELPLAELSLAELVELLLIELPLAELVELALAELALIELALAELALIELALAELALIELALIELALAGRPLALPLSRPERAWSWLPGSELALPVAGWALPRVPLPVSRLTGRPRLPLPAGILPWPGPVPGTWPAGAVLARPRLLTRVLAWAALTLARRYSSRLARCACGPFLSGLISRWLLPVLPRSRRPPGRRLSRPALRLPGEALALTPLRLLLTWVPLTRIPGLP
jgi:hypothetical protein